GSFRMPVFGCSLTHPSVESPHACSALAESGDGSGAGGGTRRVPRGGVSRRCAAFALRAVSDAAGTAAAGGEIWGPGGGWAGVAGSAPADCPAVNGPPVWPVVLA